MKSKLDKFVYIFLLVFVIAIFTIPIFGETFKDLELKRKKAFIEYDYPISRVDGYYTSEHCKFSEAEWDDLYLGDSGYEEVSQFLHFFDQYVDKVIEITGKDILQDRKITFTLQIDGYGYIDREKLIICYNKYFFLNDVTRASFVREITDILIGDSASGSLTEGLGFYIEQTSNKALRLNMTPYDIYCASKASINEENEELIEFVGSSKPLPELRKDGREFLNRQYYGYVICSRSFVQYLIDEYGIEKLMQLYYEENVDEKYNEIYGNELSDLRAAWIEKVNAKYAEVYGK